MAVDTENFNTKLYDLLKVRGYKPVPLNAKNQRVEASPQADVIEFNFTKDGEDYGKAWVSIDDAQKLVVYYSNEQADSPSGATPGLDYDDTWTGLLKQLKNWAQRRQLSFELSDKDRISDDMRHREYYKMKDNLSEGYYPMGKSASYSDSVPSVKIILQHTRQIQEGEQRFRNIARIFLENSQGERILAPTTRPGIARVYARHLAEGGVPNDDRWNHIKGLCEEYNKMAGFVRATRNGQFNESAQQLVNEGINHYNKLRESLSRMTGKRGYTAYFESWTPTLMETEGDDQTNLNELFVQETLDPRIESVMPILSRLRKNIGEMKEVTELSEWAESVGMEEATDMKTIPEEEEVEEGMVGKILGGAALIAALQGISYLEAKDAYDHSPQLQKLEKFYQRAKKEGDVEKIKEIEHRIEMQKDRLSLDKGEVMGDNGKPIDPVYESDDELAKIKELLKKNPELAKKFARMEPKDQDELVTKLSIASKKAREKSDGSGASAEDWGRALKGIVGLAGIGGMGLPAGYYEEGEEHEEGVAESSLNEFAPGENPGGNSGDEYIRTLASAWYNQDLSAIADQVRKDKNPKKKNMMDRVIDAQRAVEKILERGIVCGDGKVRKFYIDYNSDFDGVRIVYEDYSEYSDYDDDGNDIDSRTGKPWPHSKYDDMEFKDDELNEGMEENFINMVPQAVAEEDGHTEEENGMASDNLNKMAKASEKIGKKVKGMGGKDSLEPWQQQLVATAADKVDAVYHSMDDEIEEGVAEGSQPVFTPEILPCAICGAKARPIDLDFNGVYKVYCDKNHTVPGIGNITVNRAIHKWNNLQNKLNSEQGVAEDLDANQKRVGQLGPTEPVGKNEKNLRGKLVGANESVERDELADLKRLLGK